MAGRLSWVMIVVGIVLVLPACERQAPAGQADTARSESEAAPTVSSLSIGSAAAADGSVPPRTQFASADPLIASVRTSGTAKGALLEATLYGPHGRVAQQQKRISPQGTDTTNFTFAVPGAWPLGRYLVEIKVDSKFAVQQQIDVVTHPPTQVRPAKQG